MWIAFFIIAILAEIYSFSMWDNAGWIFLVLWLAWALTPSKKEAKEHQYGDYP